MSQPHNTANCRWFTAGDQVFPALFEAMDASRRTIRLETYIFKADELGIRFRNGLVKAQQRGVQVSLLVDAFGSQSLPAGFWDPLQAAGGEVCWFNPPLLKRFGFRDHRKMFVCDEEVAFVGGFNFSKQYEGDGVNSGWRDLGFQVNGPPAAALAEAFDDMFARADVQHKRFMRLRRSRARRKVRLKDCELLLSGPGRGWNPFNRALRRDFEHARDVRIIAAYFLPTMRLRRALMHVARHGGRVRLILAGKSDVLISQLAGRSLYRRLLRAGVEIYEYQPQILHAKLVIVDDTVYVGSSNLDPRSLYLNYELMLRFNQRDVTEGARVCFDELLAHSRRVEQEAWWKSRSWWRRFKQRWSYFVLVHVDPYVARWQMGKPTH